MIYVTSDLHGYPLPRFKSLLREAHFTNRDYLFVLGDVIDRNGDGGIETLQWMMLQPNVAFILGNHEALLLSCSFLFDTITAESIDSLSAEKLGILSTWLVNGAQPTLNALRTLHTCDPEAVEDILDYLRDAPLYDTVTVEGHDYLLVHSGLQGFSRCKKLSDYRADELLWCRPNADQRYFDDVYTILGHTPTVYYGSKGRTYRTSTWIDIDTGAGDGGSPMLLRLNDMREFYADSPGQHGIRTDFMGDIEA